MHPCRTSVSMASTVRMNTVGIPQDIANGTITKGPNHGRFDDNFLAGAAGPGDLCHQHLQHPGDAEEPLPQRLSQIEVQLKRRYDLIPNLVGTAKSVHEPRTRDPGGRHRGAQRRAAAVLKSMSEGSVGGAEMAKLASAENALQGALGKLNVTMEAYPDLKGQREYAAAVGGADHHREPHRLCPPGLATTR